MILHCSNCLHLVSLAKLFQTCWQNTICTEHSCFKLYVHNLHVHSNSNKSYKNLQVIIIAVPPRVVAREPDVSVRSGAGAELECVAHGNPPPTIHWRKLGPGHDYIGDTEVNSQQVNMQTNNYQVN